MLGADGDVIGEEGRGMLGEEGGGGLCSERRGGGGGNVSRTVYKLNIVNEFP